MKDSEFIELLNLYLDHEITVADAKRLEVEVQRSPERRRIYREYCQMQKACVMLAEQAVETGAHEMAGAKVVAFEPTPARGWGFAVYGAGLCAAAACVALALVLSKGNGSSTAAPKTGDSAAIAGVQITPTVGAAKDLAREVPSMVSLSPRKPEMQAVFVAQSLALTKQQRETVAAGDKSDPRFDWMNQVRVGSLQRPSADELVFEAKAQLQPDNRSFRGRKLIDAQVEQAAFQFQR